MKRETIPRRSEREWNNNDKLVSVDSNEQWQQITISFKQKKKTNRRRDTIPVLVRYHWNWIIQNKLFFITFVLLTILKNNSKIRRRFSQTISFTFRHVNYIDKTLLAKEMLNMFWCSFTNRIDAENKATIQTEPGLLCGWLRVRYEFGRMILCVKRALTVVHQHQKYCCLIAYLLAISKPFEPLSTQQIARARPFRMLMIARAFLFQNVKCEQT